MKLHPLFCNSTTEINERISITWGVPWKKGELNSVNHLMLQNKNKQNIALQSQIQAYWPDGSVKWTKHSANLFKKELDGLELTNANQQGSQQPGTMIVKKKNGWQVETGRMTCFIPIKGENWIEEITVDQKLLIKRGKLVLQLEEHKQLHDQWWTREVEGTVRSIL
ncbi:hypothetical protein JCM21714_4711 [Gracilibacillus boraciitolerans JCM 21714]|uniref:Uncharacterized protein n=1 Tax=Gracilibacillus boraciitolerans JCM 21714 TaxID=1298598 RepID=W4VQG7_9BACI|nr:hypothetical protein [Gracilibacillus boraciitolerans]GAE95467.1 hypothetical protein JCM21714_4711 [Gracilibacillus boraciitolerans JCM 21714]